MAANKSALVARSSRVCVNYETQPTHHQPHNGKAWPHAVLRLSSRDKTKRKRSKSLYVHYDFLIIIIPFVYFWISFVCLSIE
jgi:hypothetical protein